MLLSVWPLVALLAATNYQAELPETGEYVLYTTIPDDPERRVRTDGVRCRWANYDVDGDGEVDGPDQDHLKPLLGESTERVTWTSEDGSESMPAYKVPLRFPEVSEATVINVRCRSFLGALESDPSDNRHEIAHPGRPFFPFKVILLPDGTWEPLP